MGRKSTAQPRPVLNIPPRGIGPIADPNENDVLCGRGGRINSHAGNVQFREVIQSRKKEYLAPTTKKLEKAHIAAAIVNEIRGMNPPGRFLKEDRDTGLWFDIGDAKAIKKTGQALREDAPDIRPDLEDNSSGDEKIDEKSPKGKGKSEPKPDSGKKDKVSPSRLPTTQQSLARQQQEMLSGHGPQHVPMNPAAWQQGNGLMTPEQYQAQIAMPPPAFPQQQGNPYLGQTGQPVALQSGSFEPKTIPIQAPVPQSLYSIPNQAYAAGKSGGSKAVSRQAMEVLAQSGGALPEDIAFGRTFHPPGTTPTGTTLSGGDHTHSTISGLSDPLSSGLGFDTAGSGMGSARSGQMARGSSLMGGSSILTDPQAASSSRSSIRQRDPSLRLSQLGPSFKNSSRSQFMEAARGMESSRLSSLSGLESSRMSDLTASVRSMGSMARSMSFPDMGSVMDGGESWAAIMEGEEDIPAAPNPRSIFSASSSTKGTSSSRLGRRASGGMSVSMMSIGSDASSTRWLASMKDAGMMDDGRSILSEMSSDLNALDLASDTRL